MDIYYGGIMRSKAMKRTTVMLPETLRRRAALRARQRGISVGELIRNSLEEALPGASSDQDPLFEEAVFDGPAARDLSARHDKYLYDKE